MVNGGERVITLFGGSALFGVLLLTLLPLLSLIFAGGISFEALASNYLQRLLLFTLKQASLSTVLALLAALLIAHMLAGRAFWGRELLLRLLGLAQMIPAIVVIVGLVALHGRSGLLAKLLPLSGNYLYGLGGILLGHLFFNVPLATKWFLGALERIPLAQRQLAQQLNFSPWLSFRLIEWPALRPLLGGLALLIFLLCFSSFTLVLALGGGPKSTTLEVALYQALRLDLDLPRAALLALLQGAIALLLHLILYRLPLPPLRGDGRQTLLTQRAWGWSDFIALMLLALIFLLPLGLILLKGVIALTTSAPPWALLAEATQTSLALATASSVLALGLTLPLLALAVKAKLSAQPILARMVEVVAALPLIFPALTLATGYFLLALTAGWQSATVPLLIVINGLLAIPFMLRLLLPLAQQVARRYRVLAQQLELRGWSRLYYLEWPLLRAALGQAIALAFLFALGEMAAIALFGSEDLLTLPWLLYQQLGSYQGSAAAVTALWLLLLAFFIQTLFEWLFQPRSRDA